MEIYKIKDLYDCGYYVGQEVYDPDNGRVLVSANCKLTNTVLDALGRRGISDIIVSKDPVEYGQHQTNIMRTKTMLRKEFNSIAHNLKTNLEISTSMINKVEQCLSGVIQWISDNPVGCVCVHNISQNDPYVLRHSVNTCYLSLCLVLSQKMVKQILRCKERGIQRFSSYKVDPANLIPLGVAALLMDVGKIHVSNTLGDYDRLTHDDLRWDLIKKHPVISHSLLFGHGADTHTLLGVKYHHENMDGSGYPFGISGYKIHPYSRIIRIVESFDAALSVRPWADVKNPEDVYKEMNGLAGKHYDPDLLNCFLAMCLSS